MIFVITNCNKDDYQIITTHLFKKQIELFFEDGAFRVGVEINTPAELTFLSKVLRCDFLFKPFAYETKEEGDKYNTLTIVRDEDEYQNSGNGILTEE